MTEKDATPKPAFADSTRKKALLFYGPIFLISLFWICVLLINLSWGGFIGCLAFSLPILIYLFFAVWKPRDILVGDFKEQTSGVVLFLGKYHKTLLCSTGETLDKATGKKIVPIDENNPAERHRFGGWRWIGIPGLFDTVSWWFPAWYGVDENGKAKSHGGKWVNRMSTKQLNYSFDVPIARDKNNAKLSLHGWMIGRQLIPSQAILRIADWLTTAKGIVNSEIPKKTRSIELVQINEEQGTMNVNIDALGDAGEFGSLLYTMMQGAGAAIEDILSICGLAISGLKISGDIEIDQETQDYLTAKWRAKQQGDADVIKAELQAKALTVRYQTILAGKIGKKLEETIKLMEDYEGFSKKYAQEIMYANRQLEQETSSNANSLLHILTTAQPGVSSGSSGTLGERDLALIATVAKMIDGNQMQSRVSTTLAQGAQSRSNIGSKKRARAGRNSDPRNIDTDIGDGDYVPE